MSVWPTRRDWGFAKRDLYAGVQAWNIWTLLGVSDIRQRYKRSRFGQFWITLSMGIFIAGLGLVYSYLFKQPIADYIPFIAVNITIWTLISGVIGDSATAFTSSSVYLRQEALPKTIFILRMLVRNVVTFAHNLVVVPIVYLLLLKAPSPLALMAIPGFLLVLVALFFVSLFIGVLSTRFRDLPQIIANALQLLFFVTPVMWHSEQLGGGAYAVVGFNPFAAMLRVIAEPIQGRIPGPATYGSLVVFILIAAAVAVPLFARFRARLVYWL